MHMHTTILIFVKVIIENQISDTELVNSSTSSSAGNSTERLKALTRVKSKVWKYSGFVMNKAGVIVSKTHVLFVNRTSAFVETRQI